MSSVTSPELRDRLRLGDHARGWGNHYRLSGEEIKAMFQEHCRAARPVPALSDFSKSCRLVVEVNGVRLLPLAGHHDDLCFLLPKGCREFWMLAGSDYPSLPGLAAEIRRMSLMRAGQETSIPLTSPICRDGWWKPSLRNDQLTRSMGHRARVKFTRAVETETIFCVSLVAE